MKLSWLWVSTTLMLVLDMNMPNVLPSNAACGSVAADGAVISNARDVISERDRIIASRESAL